MPFFNEMSQVKSPRSREDRILEVITQEPGLDAPTIAKRLGWKNTSLVGASLVKLEKSGLILYRQQDDASGWHFQETPPIKKDPLHTTEEF